MEAPAFIRSLQGISRNDFFRRKFIGIAFALPAASLFLVFVAYPVVSSIWLSLREINQYSGAERFVGMANYLEMVKNPRFLRDGLNTLIWGAGSLVGELGLGLLAALIVNQRIRGMKFFRTVLVMPYVMPVIALALVWRWMFDAQFGVLSYGLQRMGLLAHGASPLVSLSGAMASVILANVWRSFPFSMLIYWAAMQAIENEQYESARVDGASSIQQFMYITLPNLKEATIVLLILRTIKTITYFDLIWLITGGGPAGATEHWPIWIYQEALGSFRFGFAAAIATTFALCLIVLVLAYIKIAGKEEL